MKRQEFVDSISRIDEIILELSRNGVKVQQILFDHTSCNSGNVTVKSEYKTEGLKDDLKNIRSIRLRNRTPIGSQLS